MTKKRTGAIPYAARPVPQNLDGLALFLDANFRQIAAIIQALALGHIEPSAGPPPHPQEGDFRLADGDNWNPGAGRGFYGYYNGTWHALSAQLSGLYVAPLLSSPLPNAQEGVIVRANGSGWNPGSGRGFYGLDNGTWKFLG